MPGIRPLHLRFLSVILAKYTVLSKRRGLAANRQIASRGLPRGRQVGAFTQAGNLGIRERPGFAAGQIPKAQ